MKTRVFAALLALILILSCAACRGGGAGPSQPGEDEQPAPGAGRTGAGTEAEALSLTVDGATGEMTISRPEIAEAESADAADSWTIFVYLCGTDLETDDGLASLDLEEMCRASASSSVSFVIETGGARRWHADGVSAAGNQRFVVRDGAAVKTGETERAGMGRSATLADFLSWGLENYPADRMGLILWDHGGGSISGVCFDERDGYDSLSLRELDAALLSVADRMPDKFEFIGFDACLMGTVETANILASYADYMYASQESEPGSGWDYTAIGDFLAAEPGADGAALGRVVCDSYMAACGEAGGADIATLSVIDLALVDELLLSFNSFAEHMYVAGDDATVLTLMVRGIESAENFGGNNRIEGYTNMVDLGGLIAACGEWTEGSAAALSALEEAVVYKVGGSGHGGASGLSVYYPLSVQGSQELSVFSEICPSPYYLSFVDRQGHGSVSGGDIASYEGDTWFSDGVWTLPGSYGLDAGTGYLQVQDADADYWFYIDEFDQTGESPLITFAEAPHLDEDGTFWFELDDYGYFYTADVYACVYELSEDGEDLIELGETYDIFANWYTGIFEDDFDGYWLSLPDGQNLATYIVEAGYDYILYTSPIYLNDEEVFLRLRQGSDGSVSVEGVWDGISDYGAADRDSVLLQPGDVIVPLYFSYSLESDDEGRYVGWEYTVEEDMEILYAFMESGDYLYSFCIDDIFGDYFLTDFVMFNVDEDGEIYFYDM